MVWCFDLFENFRPKKRFVENELAGWETAFRRSLLIRAKYLLVSILWSSSEAVGFHRLMCDEDVLTMPSDSVDFDKSSLRMDDIRTSQERAQLLDLLTCKPNDFNIPERLVE